MTPQQETLTKATQTTDLLVGDLVEAKSRATDKVSLLFLHDMLTQARHIRDRLEDFTRVMSEAQ